MSTFTTPVVTSMQIIPVAGHDSMLMNLSGAHAPFFTRNIVIINDNSGHTGVGEIPGGEKIRKTLEEAAPLVVGKTLGEYKNILNTVRSTFADRDAGGRSANLRPANHHSRGHRYRSRDAGSAGPTPGR